MLSSANHQLQRLAHCRNVCGNIERVGEDQQDRAPSRIPALGAQPVVQSNCGVKPDDEEQQGLAELQESFEAERRRNEKALLSDDNLLKAEALRQSELRFKQWTLAAGAAGLGRGRGLSTCR